MITDSRWDYEQEQIGELRWFKHENGECDPADCDYCREQREEAERENREIENAIESVPSSPIEIYRGLRSIPKADAK